MQPRDARPSRAVPVLPATVLSVVLLAGCGTPSGSAHAADPTMPPTSTSTSTAPPPAPSSAPTSSAPTSSAPTSSAPSSPPAASPEAPEPPPDESLERGDTGAAVAALQERLTGLGYWLGTADGEFGFLTEQAVFALQGAAGLQRDGVVGPRTRQALAEGVRPQPRSTSGSVIEVDRDAGVLVFVDDGRPGLTLHTSTGTFEEYTHDERTLLADTPAGTWEVSWSHDGWRDGALGRLYRPRYFHSDGVAVHGYPSVPAYPASHGCARVSIEAMDMIWRDGLMPRGATVLVH